MRSQRDAIIARWEGQIRTLPRARGLPGSMLRDHLPLLLDQLAALIERGRDEGTIAATASIHAELRVGEGYDVEEVVAEYRVLRQVVLEWCGAVASIAEVRVLDAAIDMAIEVAVGQYAAMRETAFHTLVDHIPQLAWIADASGAIVWFNRRWFEYTGLTLEEVRGWGWQLVHDPRYLPRVAEKWRHAVATGEIWEDTFPMRGRDGLYRWFLSRAVPIRDASGNIERWFGTNTDVTANRILEQATEILSRSLSYRDTLDALARIVVPDFADWCVVDLVDDGKLQHVAIAHADPSKVELAREFARKYPPDANAETGIARIVRTGEPEVIPEITDELLVALARSEEHLRAMRELGLRSWLVAPLTARGRTFGAIALITSESNRHYGTNDIALAVELGRRAAIAADNARLYEEAQTAARAREDMLAIVSHDLRNPLGAIDLAATLLLQVAEPTMQRHVEVIRRSAKRMEHLINDLLDLANITARRFSVTRAPVDAAELVAEMLDAHQPIAIERGITLERHVALADTTLDCDRNRITQVFDNLLGNALKFCRPGDTIVVEGVREGEHARFVIRDTGPGILAADLPHIFQPYYSSQQTKKKGTGLGLFISKAIVDAHGGTLEVASEPDHGATFTLVLPLVARTP